MADAPKDDTGDALWFLLKVVGIVFLIWIIVGGPGRAKDDTLFSTGTTSNTTPVISKSNEDKDSTGESSKTPSKTPVKDTTGNTFNSTTSPYKGKVKISMGNATSEDNPDQEYIYLNAPSSNKESVVISGWVLKNGNDERNIYKLSGGEEVPARADRVTIPLGVRLFSTSTQHLKSPIVLFPGQKAILTTGIPTTKFPFFLNTSFLTNKCMGYVGKWTPMKPSLNSSCINYEDLPEVNKFGDACYKFIRSIQKCYTPEYDYLKQITNTPSNPLNAQCRDFALRNFNYNACVKLYQDDKDFYGKEWRVFLGYRVELWPTKRNSITLYDQNGKIVDRVEY